MAAGTDPNARTFHTYVPSVKFRETVLYDADEDVVLMDSVEGVVDFHASSSYPALPVTDDHVSVGEALISAPLDGAVSAGAARGVTVLLVLLVWFVAGGVVWKPIENCQVSEKLNTFPS